MSHEINPALVILAGGKGTRLKDQLGGMPKPMADIHGKPLLQHQIELAIKHGIKEVIFLTSYRSEIIESFFGDGSQFGIAFRYLMDPDPLGTAGAVLAALEELPPHFLLLYGDVMLDVQLSHFWQTHLTHQADATLYVHPNDHPQDSDLIETHPNSLQISAFRGYPHPENALYRNVVNAGLYALNREALIFQKKQILQANPGQTIQGDFGKWLFPKMIEDGQKLMAYRGREYLKDMGTPTRLEKVRRDHASGKIAALHREHALPAVFLDRDGTVCQEVHWLSDPQQMELIPGAASAIHQLNLRGIPVILITNQPVIARGETDEAGMERIHARLDQLLAAEKAWVDAIFYCPHHPDSGFPGERADLKKPCSCRKPGTALVEAATEEFHLDLSRSWFIGDTTTDLETARRAGLRSILLETGHGGRDGKYPKAQPTSTASDLAAAVEWIFQHHPETLELRKN